MEKQKFNITINKAEQHILAIDDFGFTEGKINFLLGESGIGKTMISKTIFGILDADKFQTKINNIDYRAYLQEQTTKEFKQDGFFVFQEPSTHLNPLLKIGTQLKEGNLGTGKNEHDLLKQLWQKSDKNHYMPLLKIYPKSYRPSGGEKQRFLLIMALKKIDRYLEANSNSIPLFVFDEPTGSLDDELRNWFVNILLKKYRQKRFTILFITHDYSIISEVVNNNSDLYENIKFNELQKQQDKLVLQVFDEKQYLNWILSAKKTLQANPQKPGKCLLNLKSEIKVFGKNISINKEGGKKTHLEIREGEIIYLKAPSGMGKTTIAKIITGLSHADKFEFSISSNSYNQLTSKNKWKKNLWGKLISMTFQHADEALNMNSTVKQTLMNLPRRKRPKSKELMQKMRQIFDNEIDDSILKKRIRQLSGGQKQRINLLRALLLETPILILDEPLNGLDFNSIQKIKDLIIKRRNAGTGMLIISHNEEIMESIVDAESIYYLHQN
jgi:peptide/nickel transport system ATP-binding protein